jgi:hypothetical protein
MAALYATAGQSGVPSSEIMSEFRLPERDGYGNAINEISGLAWDADDQLLYAISDLGHVIAFKILLAGDTIQSINAVRFNDVELDIGKNGLSDTEGVVVLNGNNGVTGDSQLAIAYEDGPAAALFDANGKFIRQMDLPELLRNPDAYQSANERIESIGYSASRGFFFVPQVPLVGNTETKHTLYFDDGSMASFETADESASDTKDVIALADGSVIALEGADVGGLWSLLGLARPEMRLRRIDLSTCNSDTICPVKDYLPVSQQAMQDRFEGLTQLDENRFLAATDETNGSRIVLLRLHD